MLKQYVIKSTPVEAVKVEKENRDEIIELLSKGTTGWEELKDGTGFKVHSWVGVEPAKYGSNCWIVKGVYGECYPWEGNSFEEKFEEFKK